MPVPESHLRAAVTISVLLVLSACSMIDHYTGEGENRPIRETGLPATAEVL